VSPYCGLRVGSFNLSLMQWRAILAVAGGAGLEEVLGSVGREESQGGRKLETVDQRVNSLDQIRLGRSSTVDAGSGVQGS
jgi:hypothetical protein